MAPNDTQRNTSDHCEKLVNEEVVEWRDPDTLCGIGSFRPAFLQIFSRVGAFVGIYSVSGLLTSTLSVYVNSQVSMLEKQFGFSSSQTGVLMSCNDIGYLCTVIFAGYIARKVHIPRGLGLSTMLFGVCGILCALPFFLQDRSMYSLETSTDNTTMPAGGKQIPMCRKHNMTRGDEDNCLSGDDKETQFNLEKLWIKKVAYALIAVGMVLQGVGKSTRYPFVTLYIDDAVDKRKTGFYMGILTGTGIFGPALAYLLGGLFSKIYVTLESVDINPNDPRWIGAWWLGFLVFGACAIVFSLPIMCFPRRLRRKQSSAYTLSKPFRPTVSLVLKETKQFLQAVVRVLRNPVFSLVSLSTCLNIVGVAGMMSFLPKYIASQYTIPLWKANIILAVSNVMAVSLGAFAGGLLTRRIRMTPLNTMMLMIIFYAINIASMITGFFLGCDQPKLVGGSRDSHITDLYTPIEGLCSSECTCSDQKYFPLCGDDGQSYYSPCHAGCTFQDGMIFTNCSCIASGTASPGLCDQGCSTNLYFYAVFTFIGALFAACKIIPTFIIKIRCVAEKDRAVATALSGFLTSTIGWMPGPVIFGYVIDGTCTLWKYICNERQSCQLYDIVFFRNALHAYGVIARTLAMLVVIGLYVVFRITKKTDWINDKPNVKQIDLNGEMTAMNEAKIQTPHKS